MTVWERGLRPKQDSHWVVWLALAAAVVFLAYKGAEWLLEWRTPTPCRHDIECPDGRRHRTNTPICINSTCGKTKPKPD
ncbi:hypothetical protein RCH10_000173 [Variovorax sp. GrIS 2.14]